ncbi:zinc-dependent alcohol dehydrogenase [Microbacterium sp. No. 7]|uniref:zinc-dependent alcohol dehydrogenase n=1 Tax=Microbacterium sp. No. 7 TaxID=1714373 RepID=UPI0006D17635|nr:zinc-binding dehydrogenase [Microbacterium sp. No. 7]ALJ21182.1 theronine dehydrogenase [Microbacterium sp. No. 7]
MRTLTVTAPDRAELIETELPAAGPRDLTVKIRACGICGSDVLYAHLGGVPSRPMTTPLGHEPAGEVVAVGAEVEGVQVGDHVVVNPMANRDGIIGNGGAQGALSDAIVLFDARPGVHFRVIPKDIPWEVAALNEPMAVAYHGVNRSGDVAGKKVVVFGAGPVGLGAAIGFQSKGAAHVTVVDVVPNRLEKALLVGADAVIDSSREDVAERLRELHGEVPGFMGQGTKPDTDVYYDAAGVAPVVHTALRAMKSRAVLTIVAVHKKPIEIDFQEVLTTEPDIRWSMGYPTEIFEVTDSIIAHADRYRHIISDLVPFDDAERALALAGTPGATDKVVVTFD